MAISMARLMAEAVMTMEQYSGYPLCPQATIESPTQLLSEGDFAPVLCGMAGTNYALDRSFSLSPANWVSLLTNPADAVGVLIFTNTPDPATNNFWHIRSVP